MKIPKPTVIDFESDKIEGRPKYPPKPVGVSIEPPGQKGRYYAWGHPTKNNCSKTDAVRALKQVWVPGEPILFHNSKFDVDVAQEHMELANVKLDPLYVHDTQFIMFLLDPHAYDLGLKPMAQKHLCMEPEEQDAVKQWLLEHWSQLRGDGLVTGNFPKGDWGAYIGLAPGDLVGKYATGDTLRTKKLFAWGYPQVVEMGMLVAYQREQRLMPILLRNEREGMKCDLSAMERDYPVFVKERDRVDNWLSKRLKYDGPLPLSAPQQMAEILDSRGIVTEWTLTKTGLKSMSKKVLKPSMYNDKKVFLAMGYRTKLQTCIGTYYEPWMATARETGGILHSGWNQTRNDADAGTRSGRLSGSPNFMAVAKDFEDKGDGWSHPDFIKDLKHLPLMRNYILPDSPRHWWGRRDFNQQELRILAHFENGLLMEAYRNNPKLDVHAFIQQSIKELLGIDLPRTPVKTLNFGLIYGQGVPAMAEKLEREVAEIQQFRKAQFQAIPGLKELDKTCKERGRRGEPITTWGGRVYYCEEPRIIDGRWRTFEYKLLNYLIQPSGADCTKEAIIRHEDAGWGDARFTVTVHDEINLSAPKGALKREMLRLRDTMQSIEFDVPMLSDGEFGPAWGQMDKLKEPEPDFSAWRAA